MKWLLGLLIFLVPAHARDLGQWEMSSPDMRAYYQSLMQPDWPTASCCGESDAYYADEVEPCRLVDGPDCALVAVITDTRDDAPRGRRHVPPGTKIAVPRNKIRKAPIPNPTNHNLIFLSVDGRVYCWEPIALL